MNKSQIWAGMGIMGNPFRRIQMESADLIRCRRAIEDAIEERGLLAIAGERGTGKSFSVDRAIPEACAIITPCPVNVEAAKINHIMEAILYDLSDETPRRSQEARSRQVRRILGDANRRQPVVLIIEDAHLLHHATVRALKRLREMKWMGRGDLITIILVGQADPFHNGRANMDEVRLRADSLWMEGLSREEAKGFIGQSVGRAFTDDAIEAVAASRQARNWLDLQDALNKCMARAVAGGRKKVSVLDVMDAIGGGGGLKEALQQSGISQAEAARRLGMNKSTLNRTLSGQQDDPEVRQKVEDLLKQQIAEAAA